MQSRYAMARTGHLSKRSIKGARASLRMDRRNIRVTRYYQRIDDIVARIYTLSLRNNLVK